MSITSKIGAHVSIAGGIWNAPSRALEEGCETFQCFTRSPQGGGAPKLDNEVIDRFRAEMNAANIETFYIHSPYYINLASLTNSIRYSSIKVLREELERGTKLGAAYVMTHPGSHSGQTLEDGITKVRKALDKILENYDGSCKLLLEISAGAGNVLGDTFDEVGNMIAEVKGHPGFGGVCFDTCHAFASGYDFLSPEKASRVLDDFDQLIGLEFLKLTHVNDSKTELGGRRDRHEHIGQGHIGAAGLSSILTTNPFSQIDWILETESAGRPNDIKALRELREK